MSSIRTERIDERQDKNKGHVVDTLSAQDLAWSDPNFPLQDTKKIALEEIAKVMEGSADTELLQRLLDHEEARIFIEDFLNQEVGKLFENVASDQFFTTAEGIARVANINLAVNSLLIEQLSFGIGKLNAEKLLHDPEYRKALATMIEESKLRAGTSGPQLLPDEYSLADLVSLYEIFGNNLLPIVNTLYLKNNANIGDDLTDTSTEAVQIFDSKYYDTGELRKAHATVGFKWATDDEEAQIFRTFNVYRDKPGAALRRVVNLDLMELPSTLRAGGVGTKVLQESLRVYDLMGVDEIKLKANIDMGAYAWAVLGFGWDFELMKENLKKETAAQCIQSIITDARTRFFRALSDMDLVDEDGIPKTPGLKSLLELFDVYLNSPLAVTPQMLAAIGKDGPYFRRDEYGNWHEEQEFLNQKNDEINSVLKEHPNHKGSFHAGKLSLLGSTWYGKINLKDKQERTIVENAIKRRANP